MTHYRLSDSMPSAIILSRNPRSSSLDELKTYRGTDIFLNDGNEFQIKLFNPLQIKIGVSISINGKSANHLLVLNPGEESIIDRFVDEKRRMIFETYKYDDNNPSAKKAVQNNGLIEIKFFREHFDVQTATWSTTPHFQDYNTTGNPAFYPTTTIGGSYSRGTFTTNTGGVLFSQSLNTQEPEFVSPGLSYKEKDLSLKETGIVSKGSESNQDFKTVNVTFETFPFHTITYKLKPLSEKQSYNVEVRDYCTNCGYRLRNDKWVFCPKCGNKI
ncbi:MAG: zinc ribbon domain-containing protein [bacterium]